MAKVLTDRMVDNIVNEIGAGIAKVTKSEKDWKAGLLEVIAGLQEAVNAL